MFAKGLNTSDGFRFYQINGADTYGQWLVKSAVSPGAPLPVYQNSNSPLSGSQLRRLNLSEEYFLYESEMSMYFGSSLHGWDSSNVHDFLNEDFGIVEYWGQCTRITHLTKLAAGHFIPTKALL